MRGFTFAPRAILETEQLTATEKIIYLKLLDFSFNNVYCFPKLETISERIGVSERSIQRATKTLRELGLIKIYREHTYATNHYIMIPTDWVISLQDSQTNPIPEDEQYIESKQEFDELIAKIRSYYEEIGRTVTAPKKRQTTKRQTLADKIEVLEEKLNSNNFELSAQELCIYFAKAMRDIKQMAVTVDWGKDTAIMKELFINNPSIDIPTALKVIDTYIKTYDRHFKKASYPYPRISYLRMEFIFNKVIRLCLLEMQQNETPSTETNNDDLVSF